MNVKTNYKLRLRDFFSCFIASGLLWCKDVCVGASVPEEPIEPSDDNVLLPEAQARQVDVAGVKILGKLNEADMKDLVRIVGRVRNIDYKIVYIDTAFDDLQIAAEIGIPKGVIFCVKRRPRVWELFSVGRIVI